MNRSLRSGRFTMIGALVTLLGWSMVDGSKAVGQLIQGGLGSFGGSGPYYSGQATVLNLSDIHNGPNPIVICDTGPLPSSGGTLEVTVLETNIAHGDLSLETARAFTTATAPRPGPKRR